MISSHSVARRLRLGVVGDGAGPLDANQFGAASGFCKSESGHVARQLPANRTSSMSGGVLAEVLEHHKHLLVFDAQLNTASTIDPDTLAEATLWLLNQGVDVILFCSACSHSSLALEAALDYCHKLGVTMLACVSAAWPASHPAVIGVAAQTQQNRGMHWMGGKVCSILHGDYIDNADAVAAVASLLLTGVANGVARDQLRPFLQSHCLNSSGRRAG